MRAEVRGVRVLQAHALSDTYILTRFVSSLKVVEGNVTVRLRCLRKMAVTLRPPLPLGIDSTPGQLAKLVKKGAGHTKHVRRAPVGPHLFVGQDR